MLRTIKSEELLFSGNVEDDRTNTFIELNDYDWMQYKISTRFRTADLGVLEVCFTYFGTTESDMTVKQTINGTVVEYAYLYPTDIFEEHIKAFLIAHINAWSDEFAFNGEDYVLAFYNDVIEKGKLDRKETL